MVCIAISTYFDFSFHMGFINTCIYNLIVYYKYNIILEGKVCLKISNNLFVKLHLSAFENWTSKKNWMGFYL